jgi:hypothetical protein
MPARCTTPRFRSAVRVALAAGALLVVAAPLAAHDFWLVPGAFPFAEGAGVEVLGQTSVRFPTSVSPVALARVARAVIVDATGAATPVSDLSHRGTSLLLRAKPAAAGQYVVAADLQPRSTRQTGEGLLRYVRLEGAPDAAARIEREGRLNAADSVTRTDAKYAKTLVDVGTRGPRAFAASAGQPLEFTPERDPAQLRAGDTLRLRLAFRGQPVTGITAHAGIAPVGGVAADTSAPRDPDVRVTTDAQGVLRLPISRTGLWNVRTIHVVPAGAAAWETHWATFVFRAGR